MQRDTKEASTLNQIWTRTRDGPYVSPTRQKLGMIGEPRDSQGRLCGTGYEESDHELSQAPAELVVSPEGATADSTVVVESLCDRVAKRRRLASADEIEAELLNSSG